MLGAVAVAVHPEDERYAHLVGQQLTLPLTGRTIPVIADAYVDREFGTGCVKITPAHDFNDFAIGQRHGLAPIPIFTLTATVNDNAPEKYRGLERYVEMVHVVNAKQGVIDKFLGDAVLCIFEGPDSAQRAVACGVEMLTSVRAFNAANDFSPANEIQIGVGVHSGPVILGTIGSSERMDSTVLGLTVNLAKRIEN